MQVKKSFREYPRPDTAYMGKSSFNFDMMRAKIFENRKGVHMEVFVWLAHLLVGLMVGCAAFILTIIEDELVQFKTSTVQSLIDSGNGNVTIKAYSFYVLFGLLCVLIACSLTIWVGPGASGSGVAEIMAMLNGVNYPDAIRHRTLLVKMFGTVLAVCGGLCIGKEGPLAHIGACLGAMA